MDKDTIIKIIPEGVLINVPIPGSTFYRLNAILSEKLGDKTPEEIQELVRTLEENPDTTPQNFELRTLIALINTIDKCADSQNVKIEKKLGDLTFGD